ncbi:NAD(P)-dependent oxidoreductase [Rhizobiales bacterium L72]|uniref:NAD(P)-dependent oxidoreductase n=2 Tax=Propylenella binzhouense TaxID=2555902 RepID=A0A964T1Q3_9HYPH|nr:NAD(P)-dependent oxidoreductase [Propylenella binzhouense]MYZ46364.1 NAD(P)-dependent oxidoreductase [Propylenella binzhouense]
MPEPARAAELDRDGRNATDRPIRRNEGEEAGMRTGVAGLGRMGSAIAERLLEVGYEVVVWNRTPEKTKPLVGKGALAAADPAELAGESDVVITILTDAGAIDTVYRGENGLLAGDLKGKLVIDMSTVRPETEKRLAEDVRAAGATFVECPVGGTTGPARTGKLIGFMGGETADVERARPVLEQLCRRLDHVGPVGAGASVKLAINLPLLVYYQALGEAYSLLRHLGNDPELVMEIFAESSGGPNILKSRGAAIGRVIAGDEPGPATFDVDSIRKDLRTMIEEARSRGFELPLVACALGVYDEASASGLGGKDSSALAAYWPARTNRA